MQGVQEALTKGSKEGKKETSLDEPAENQGGGKEEKKKRSYCLKLSTIRKLQELKLRYPVGTSLEDIVDDAICVFYDIKKRA
jgi:ABC-type Zn2+ transport system substrate-binding protein/surface adhesin